MSTLSSTLYKYTGAIFFVFKELGWKSKKKNKRRGDEEIVELSKTGRSER